MYVCLCKGLTESDVQRLAPPAPLCPQALIAALGLDDEVCCGRCAVEVDEIVTLVAPPKQELCTER
jgi:bacterioferritin-associated ferredoxin